MADKVKFIAALVTASKETGTGDPNKGHDALHPCLDCRQMLRVLMELGYVRPETLAISLNDADPNQIRTDRSTLGHLLNDVYQDDPPVGDEYRFFSFPKVPPGVRRVPMSEVESELAA